MLYRNRVGDPKNICVLCGLKDCVRSFTLWCKRHPSASQDLYSHSEAAGENAEDLWRRNVEKEACYICGTKDCLRSFADIKNKHTGMVEDLKSESLKARQYIIYRNIKVKSGTTDIMVNGKHAMDSVQSSHCTGLAFTSDYMCDHCREILREPATRIAFRRLCSGEKNDSLGEKFAVSNVQEILTCVQEKGIYCAENHPGKDIILGCAELYREGKLTEDDFFHKIQHLMIEVGRHGTKKRIVWGKHPEILFWALRGYLRFGDDFVDHLSGEGFKLDREEGEDLVFSFKGKFLLIPGRRTLQRYSPAYSVTDGISRSQVRLLIQCLEQNKVMSIEKQNTTIFPCCLQYDGLKLKPALEYCRHHHSIIGLSSGPMAHEKMSELRDMDDNDRRKKMATLPFAKEALEFIAESLDSKIALPMGHFLVNDTGSSEELWELISNTVKVLQCCERCLQQVETGTAELEDCKIVCHDCTTSRQLCERCKAMGYSVGQWKSTIRPCFSCAESRLSCKRLVVCVLASDCLEKQKKILRQLEEKRSSEVEEATLVDKNTGEIIIIPSPDDPHTDKNIVAEHDNYWQMKNGEVFCTKIVQVLRSHKDVSISKPVADAITQEALSRIDRMSNETFMGHVSLRLQEALNDTGPVVVTVASNVRYGEEGNKRKKVEGELFGRLTACYVTEESRVFLADGEKDLIYEANIANPPTAEVISKAFKSPTDVVFIRDKPQNLLICDSLGIGKFYLSSGKVLRPVITEIKRPFKAALVKERKQVWVTDCVSKTVVMLNLGGNKAKLVEHEFKEPTRIAFLPALDVVAVCDALEITIVLFTKNGDSVVAISLPRQITPVHVSCFGGFGNDVFLASNENILYKMKITLDNHAAEIEEIAGHRPHPVFSDQDGPAASTKLVSINGLWSVGRACFIADGGKLRLYTPLQEFERWMEVLRDGHEAYGLAEKRLGDRYKSVVRARPYSTRIKALEERKRYFGNWQNEVADRLPGSKTASMGKFGTPATKTMENTRMSFEGKRCLENFLKEHGLNNSLEEFKFTSVTTLRTEGMFGVYNRDQVVPSALEFKYLSSRSALECAMKSAMGLGFKSKRETRYEHKDEC